MANKPNNPSLWSRAKSLAKQKFDVYPSAYANGWASKWYKGKGGTWRKAMYGMEMPYMEDGGKPEWLLEAQLKAQGYSGDALRNKLSSMMNGGMMFREVDGGDMSIPNLSKLEMGGYFPRFMEDGGYTGTFSGNAYYKHGGENNGSMALGQMSAVVDKLSKLREFVGENDNLDPWIASKLAVMDHSADAIYDYLSYGEDAEGMEEEEAPMTEMEMEQMKEGGIPTRYKAKGFNKVGVKRQSNRPGKKWMVLAKKGDQYKIVHGGYKGMKDFTQHGSEKRKKNFWNRMGGKQSSKATDPFSPLYWHKRFGTWQDGGVPSMQQPSGGGQEQIMQVIQAYAQIAQVDPRQIMQKLQSLPPEQQQKAVQQMIQAIQQAQQGGGGQEQPMMRMGGGAPCYQCGGSYGYGGMTNEMGGSVVPAMPGDVYDLPSYNMGGDSYGYMNPAMMAYGGININPANRGKFTASAQRAGMGVQEFAGKVLANKEDYSSTQVKRANFARNAAGWKKQDGGSMDMDQTYDLTNEQIQNLINQGYEIQYV